MNSSANPIVKCGSWVSATRAGLAGLMVRKPIDSRHHGLAKRWVSRGNPSYFDDGAKYFKSGGA